MKYSLIIGHQLFEKNNDKFPTVRVTLDGRFVDEFTCDNEESTQLQLYEEKFVEIKGDHGYNFKQLRLFKTEYRSPKKFTVIELDSSNWPSHSKLSIEVLDNASNYNNGFMTKRSMVLINPVFLIKTDLLHDKNKMQRIMQYEEMAYVHPTLLRKRGKKIVSRWRWPGRTAYPVCMDTNGIFWRVLDACEYSSKGGNFKTNFNIVKKHKGYILQQTEAAIDHDDDQSTRMPPINGIFRIDDFFRAWYQSYSKEKFIARYGATYNRDDESIRHLELAPAKLENYNSEIGGNDHFVIRNIKNK